MQWQIALMTCMALMGFSTANGQITLPEKVEVGEKIVATVQATIPAGATFDGGWSISCDAGSCQAAWEPLKTPNSIGVWTKIPGTYNVKYSGFWINLKEVKFKDGDGNEVVIQSYLGHGMINEQATVVVTGGNQPDPPNPPEPPTPGGPFRIVMFYDGNQLDNMPADQRALLTSLKYRKALEAQGHVFLESLEKTAIERGVSDAFQKYIASVEGDPLPRVAIAPIDGGYIADFPLPQNFEALQELLNSDDVASYYRMLKRMH